jgi:hypothetical protein
MIIPQRLWGKERWNNLPIPLGGIANEILTVDGVVYRLAQPDIVPGTPRLPSIEKAEHRCGRSTFFHHLRRGTLGHPERFQRAQVGDQIDAPVVILHALDRLFVAQRVVKDNPL